MAATDDPQEKGSALYPDFSDTFPKLAERAHVAITPPTYTRLRESAAEAVTHTDLHNKEVQAAYDQAEATRARAAQRKAPRLKRHTHRDFTLEDAIDLIKQGYGPSAVSSRTGRDIGEIKEVCKERGIRY